MKLTEIEITILVDEFKSIGWAWRLKSIIPATREAAIGRIMV
jgi:hypothetical protein